MNKFLEKFSLKDEQEAYQNIIATIDKGVVFRGTNLWVLIIAIFVASLGLNVNSTAVIIGAMLISPLMGPIMGIGLGMGIKDISLLRKALHNFLIATGVALATSTVFFLLSPLREAHSEILSRTAPNIFDVLIALFGGLAGILATSSKQKGNVIPGVAIATALMPPLCTAGYGLATLQFNFLLGAFYLFIINAVFIALATFIIVRVLHFPLKEMQTVQSEKRAMRIAYAVVLFTLLPSIYLGYQKVQQNRFTQKANQFITNEAHFANDYLLNKKIDAETRSILLVFGGKQITTAEKEALNAKFKSYQLENTVIEIKQGFAYLSANKDAATDQLNQLSQALDEKEKDRLLLQSRIDSISTQQKLNAQIFEELKIQYPLLKYLVIQPSVAVADSSHNKQGALVMLTMAGSILKTEKTKIESWLKLRLQLDTLQLIFNTD